MMRFAIFFIFSCLHSDRRPRVSRVKVSGPVRLKVKAHTTALVWPSVTAHSLLYKKT
ncbi:unnamed protein product [Brassica oleracea var. botrytis]